MVVVHPLQAGLLLIQVPAHYRLFTPHSSPHCLKARLRHPAPAPALGARTKANRRRPSRRPSRGHRRRKPGHRQGLGAYGFPANCAVRHAPSWRARRSRPRRSRLRKSCHLGRCQRSRLRNCCHLGRCRRQPSGARSPRRYRCFLSVRTSCFLSVWTSYIGPLSAAWRPTLRGAPF